MAKGNRATDRQKGQGLREMRTTETLLSMLSERGQQRKPVKRLYRLLRNRHLLLTAYGRIAPNKGITTPGTMPDDAWMA